MTPAALQPWLKKKKTTGFALHLLVGVLGLLAGFIVVFLTFWFTYAVILFGWYGVAAIGDLLLSKRLVLSHNWRLAGSGIFVGLLFFQHFRTNPWHWGEYPQRDYDECAGHMAAQSGVMGSLVMLLAHPGASANIIADILLSGPRLVTGSCKLAAQGFRSKRLDEKGCAELLAILYERPNAVPYAELQEAGWDDWFGQLRCLDGVLFLQKGLVLSVELRKELDGLQNK